MTNDGSQLSVLVISCSLDPNSRSAILAEKAKQVLDKKGVPSDHLDLRTVELPLCDGSAAYNHPSVSKLNRALEDADAILLAASVYNFDLNASAKNLIELTGSVWQDKVVGLMCAAGGNNSYMAPLGLANSLMLDFRCHIVPRFVYAVAEDFSGDELDPDIETRVEELVWATVRLARGLALSAE